MLRFLYTLFLTSGILLGNVHAASVPSAPVKPTPGAKITQQLFRLNVQEIEKLSGKKLSFREKVRWKMAKVLHRFVPAFAEGEPTPKQLQQGRMSMIFGLTSVFMFLMGFIVAPIVFLSLPLGIAGLVLGMKSVKGNGNTQGIVGLISGGSTILMWLLIVILIAALISTGGIWG